MKKQIMIATMLSTILVATGCTAPYQTIHSQLAAQPQVRQEATQRSNNVGNYLEGAQDENDRLRLLSKLSFFPRPSPKNNRNVIYLPKINNERDVKVELIIGTNMQTDCNYYQLAGDFQKKTLYGWGYTYYELGKLRGPMSTMINCPTTRKTTTFLRVAGTDEFISYNSDVPIVIYAPSGLEVSYRIWRTDTGRQLSRVE